MSQNGEWRGRGGGGGSVVTSNSPSWCWFQQVVEILEKEPEFRSKGNPASPEKSLSETRRMKLPLVQFPSFPDPRACLAGASELTSFNQLTFSAVLTTASCTIDMNRLHSQSDLSLK